MAGSNPYSIIVTDAPNGYDTITLTRAQADALYAAFDRFAKKAKQKEAQSAVLVNPKSGEWADKYGR